MHEADQLLAEILHTKLQAMQAMHWSPLDLKGMRSYNKDVMALFKDLLGITHPFLEKRGNEKSDEEQRKALVEEARAMMERMKRGGGDITPEQFLKS
jgi:hypothetical protein